MGSRVTNLLLEHPDVVDYFGRALIDGSPLGTTIWDTLAAFGTARWTTRKENGEARDDIDVTWAALNSLVLALGTLILRGHIERQSRVPSRPRSSIGDRSPSTHCCAKDCFHTAVTTARRPTTSNPLAANPFAVRAGRLPQNCVNARVNELRLSKPTAVAVSCTDWPGAASSAIARSIRACNRYVRHDSPSVSWNRRRSVRSDTATARLTSSAVTESRCSFVKAIAAATIG